MRSEKNTASFNVWQLNDFIDVRSCPFNSARTETERDQKKLGFFRREDIPLCAPQEWGRTSDLWNWSGLLNWPISGLCHRLRFMNLFWAKNVIFEREVLKRKCTLFCRAQFSRSINVVKLSLPACMCDDANALCISHSTTHGKKDTNVYVFGVILAWRVGCTLMYIDCSETWKCTVL